MAKEIPLFMRIRAIDGSLLLDAIKVKRPPTPGEVAQWDKVYRLSSAPLVAPKRERLDVGEGVEADVYDVVATAVGPLPKPVSLPKKAKPPVAK